MEFRLFDDMNALLTHLKTWDYVYYHAPMDVKPYSVKVRRYTVDNDKPLKSTAVLWSSGTGDFKVKLAEHFDRFRVRLG